MTATRKATKKVRAHEIHRGMKVIHDGEPFEAVKVASKAYFPDWPSQPYTMVTVEYAEGSRYAMSTYGANEWVEVAR